MAKLVTDLNAAAADNPWSSSSNGTREMAALLVDTDPEKALAWLLENPDGRALDYAVLSAMVEKGNGARVMAFFEQNAGIASQRDWQAALSRLVEKDPALVEGRLSSLSGEMRGTARQALAGVKAKDDPVGALQWAAAESEPEIRQKMQAEIFTTWSGRDIGACMEHFASEGLTPEELGSVINSAGRISSEPVEGWLKQHFTELDAPVAQALMDQYGSSLAQHDPDGYWALISAQSPAEQLGSIGFAATGYLAARGPAGAAAWADGLPPDLRQMALQSLFATGGGNLTALADAIPPDAGPVGAIRTEMLWRNAPARLFQEYDSLSPDLQASLWQQVPAMEISQRYNASEAAALREMLAKAPAGNANAASWAALQAVQLVRQDTAAAADWVASLPDGTMAQLAACNMVRQWEEFAPDKAAAWAATLPAGSAARQGAQGVMPPGKP